MKMQLFRLLLCAIISVIFASTAAPIRKKEWIQRFNTLHEQESAVRNTGGSSQPVKNRSITIQNDRITKEIQYSERKRTHLPIPSQPERNVSFTKTFTSIRPDWSLVFHDRLTIYGPSMRNFEEVLPDNGPITNSETNSLLKEQLSNVNEIKRPLSPMNVPLDLTKATRSNSVNYALSNDGPSSSKRFKTLFNDTNAVDTATQTNIQPATSIPQDLNISPVENESKYYKSKKDNLIYKFSQGILSWSYLEGEKNFELKTHFTFSAIEKRLFIATNSYGTIPIFKFACEIISVFGSSIFNRTETIVVTFELVEEIFEIVYSLDSQLRPSYYLFGPSDYSIGYMIPVFRIPFFFLFTTIANNITKEKPNTSENLKSLLKLVHYRLKESEQLQSREWDFLRRHVFGQLIHLKGSVGGKKKYLHLDITTVNYIYYEMKNSKNQEVRKFFANVWGSYQKECKAITPTNSISNEPQLIIPREHDFYFNKHEGAVRKLYQIKFTELLFSEWSSFDDLIRKYLELKKDFGSFAIDFRLRIFSKRDFYSLKGAIDKIESVIKTVFNSDNPSPIDQSDIRCFFIELVNFINIKCAIFIYDLHKNTKKDLNDVPTFSVIKKIISIVGNTFHFLSSNGIKFEKDFIAIEQLNDGNQIYLSSFYNLITKFEEYPQIISGSNPLIAFLSCINLPRFKCSEYIIEIDDMIRSKNYSELFENEEYKSLRNLWRYKPRKEFQLSAEDEDYYVEQFRKFLFHYNQ